MYLPGIPDSVLMALQAEARLQGGVRLALVGGAVRDALLHHSHRDPWRDLPDLDLVVEGSTEALAQGLRQRLGAERVPELRVHGSFGTVEMVLDGVLLDLAQSRQERYLVPGDNPVVQPGPLRNDLARRDFTVNAMALLLGVGEAEPELLDLHGGQGDLAARQLNFLHVGSVQDDPTRVVRGARYAARLGFCLAPQALEQVQVTLAAWPWPWRHGDAPDGVPPALGTRLRMELELLFAREPWRQAVEHLQAWGALPLLDPLLQNDRLLLRRLRWAERLGVPLLCALVAASSSPLALAQRLQLPVQQQRWIEERKVFLIWLAQQALSDSWQGWSAARWTEALETRPWSPEVVALEVALMNPCWRPLLRWWGRWRHVKPPQTARDLIATGLQPGPQLGEALRQSRLQRLESMR
ncbi:CCA tRNA nucleotidyltransferase [Synechococcus sp. BS56D]|uniref:CCA tRNA nucleotidyltransferase n=1 Tax=Synechococcus sp. BS56D TaxID=2055944 RepID=UPI001F0DCB4A|nr:CCA tRNA nucleotidyltransferase [Synechococcus sp. BS56D]